MTNIEEVKPQDILPSENAEIKHFFNPICQQTYKALPKIYGLPITTKRKLNINKKSLFSPPKHCCVSQEHRQNIINKYLNKKVDLEYCKRLSEPKLHNCIKKYCFCNKNGKQSRSSRINMNKVKLPQIKLGRQGYLLDDIQSKHKVLKTQPNPQIGTMSGLGQLVSKNARDNAERSNYSIRLDQEFNNPQNQFGQDQYNNKKDFLSTYSKNSFLNKKDSSSRLLQSDEEKYRTAQNRLTNRRKFRQFAQQDQQAGSKKSQAMSISSSNYRLNQKKNTMFNEFNNRQQAILKKSRVRSTLSNGLFKIPEDNQYDTYIEDYKPLDANFSLKKLIAQQNFKVVRLPKGVYFGQINQSMKDGQGVMITQKEIYQGKFQNNIKVKGCERNIDGVFIGQFVNGQRSGQGIFRWNNEQIFEGSWKQGTKNGHGLWTSPKGDYYDGQWVMNRQQGAGTFKHKNSTYKGNFLNFLKHGYGQERFANGDFYKGQYNEGKPHGKGRYQWSQGGYYQGNFVRGFREGQGKWVQNSGDVYQGEFYRDFKHGRGKQSYKSGEYFIGQFKQGVQAKGKLYNAGGNLISETQ